MGYFSSSNPSSYLHYYQFLLKIFLLNLMLQSANSNKIDLHQLVFTTCITQNQTFQNYDSISKLSIASSLFQEFLDKSLESKFFETYAGDENIAILGLFQCRNDLNYNECHICTNRLVDIYSHFCGERLPARVQLSGCYLDYKAEEEREISKLQMLHKVCSRKKANSRSFLEEMSYAFAEIESCGMNGNGFCDLSYGKVHVMAQCVGNLGGCDCGECVHKAVQIVHDECAYSLAGEVYLDGCYLSYNYGKYKISHEGKGSKEGTQKLAAIVAGGILAAILLGAVFYFMKSCGKKDDDYW
ncbi:plasmodesmata-located protein 4-like [Lycium barbarum]|uniref:plasmodesmata-located protein 4-like n=1 Tax=Lycium barbarum TaxID=112863 RepID=UPI00293F2D73|nr:plasmodesmata-located protein 4-like [Lycium barbarum]